MSEKEHIYAIITNCVYTKQLYSSYVYKEAMDQGSYSSCLLHSNIRRCCCRRGRMKGLRLWWGHANVYCTTMNIENRLLLIQWLHMWLVVVLILHLEKWVLCASQNFRNAFCWSSVVCWYTLSACTLLWPVLSWISYSGTCAWKRSVTAVARKLCLVLFPVIPALEHMLGTILPSWFLPMSTFWNQGADGLSGTLDKGQR